MEALQITQVSFPELLADLKKDREQVVALALARREEPVDFPAKDIMEMFGWKTLKKFYKERRARGVKTFRVIGSTPTYIPAHFLKSK